MSICIENARVWDGESDELFAATVVIEQNRIARIAREPLADAEKPRDAGDTIDAGGMTLMPGLVEGHCHPTFTGISFTWELGRIPPEMHTLLAAQNLRLLLAHGFTAIFEAASAKPMIGVTLRDAVNSGVIEGPRMRAASPEITTTAGLGDERQRHLYEESFGMIADGVDEMRQVVRTCIRDGVDTVKINISGDEFISHARAEITPLEDEELAAVARVAKTFNRCLAAHARSSASVKMAVKHGVDCIYHCDFADEEALDALESVRDTAFVGPAFGLVHNATKEGEKAGITPAVCEAMQLYRKFDACCATYHEIRKRGIPVVIGGDYGFAVTPMGQNARDLEHFVRYFGFSPIEALRCATINGARLMGMEDEIGRVKEGFLADLLLVRGDPTQDVGLLQHQHNLAMIMKDGQLFKDPRKSDSHESENHSFAAAVNQ